MDLHPPIGGRAQKPRRHGLTMVIDKGLGLRALSDLLETAADWIDFLKLGFGTSLLYPPHVLRRKLELATAYGVDAYPGGTLLEAAVLQGKTDAFFRWCSGAGFSFVEVSDGTIQMEPGLRRELIRRARDAGFGVLSEAGKKDPDRQPGAAELAEQAAADLEAGAWKVIIEARDAGRGIGIFDGDGRLRAAFWEELLRGLPAPDDVIWEAPEPSQQRELLLRLGPNVSLGNVQPEQVVTLEAMRVGLRSDTLRRAPGGPARETAPEKAGFRRTV